jgi:hypothetical protein
MYFATVSSYPRALDFLWSWQLTKGLEEEYLLVSGKNTNPAGGLINSWKIMLSSLSPDNAAAKDDASRD